MENEKKCKYCKVSLEPTWHFCPSCGKVAIEKPPDTSVLKQILIYSVSFFLAPLGLAWGIRYLRSSDNKAKIVGLVSILLTLITICVTFYTLYSFMSYYSTMLDGLSRGKYLY